MPSIHLKEKDDILLLDSILPEKTNEGSFRFENSNIGIREKSKEHRITLYHYVVHAISLLIVVCYILFIIFGTQIPCSYSTIVSVVIGFYFARALFKSDYA